MRLIDADKVKRAFIGNRYGTKAIEYVIDDAPTVKAISVEWLKGIKARYLDYTSVCVVNEILNLWEKENEERTNA